MPASKVGKGSFEMRSVRQELPPQDCMKGKQNHSYYTEVDSQATFALKIKGMKPPKMFNPHDS